MIEKINLFDMEDWKMIYESIREQIIKKEEAAKVLWTQTNLWQTKIKEAEKLREIYNKIFDTILEKI